MTIFNKAILIELKILKIIHKIVHKIILKIILKNYNPFETERLLKLKRHVFTNMMLIVLVPISLQTMSTIYIYITIYPPIYHPTLYYTFTEILREQ